MQTHAFTARRPLRHPVGLALMTAAVAVLSLGTQTALAQQKVDTAKSEMQFVSKQMGVPVEGRFRKFDAQISFDPKKLDTSKVSFTIDTGSATLGVPETDAEMPKATWFNVAKFPTATFQSTSIKATSPGRYDVSGKLSIKGNSRDLVVPVTLTQSGATTTATGTAAIKRLDFKIGEGEWADTSMVANDVQIKFKLLLSGVPAL